MSALMHALALAERGIPSFPCLASKAPACRHGFKAATADAAALRTLWRRHPGPLMGVPTGPASGFDALDIDPRHGGDAWERDHAGQLPTTRVHVTRSGGRHYLFRYHDGGRSTVGTIAAGVDTRCSGGFIIWWPAAACEVLHDGPLAAWPDWLLPLILPKPPPPILQSAPQRYAPSETTAERMIRRVLYQLETAPPGERHPRLRAAACTIGGLLQSTGIGKAEAASRLLDAVKRAGGDAVDDENALGTIAWGLDKGAKDPLTVGGRNA